MSRAGAPGWARSAYLVTAVLLGIPTALVGGYLAVIALVFGIGALSDAHGSGMGMLLSIWGLGGVCGIIAWGRLSLAYAIGDLQGLTRCGRLWWSGLMAGIAAAAMVLYVLLTLWAEDGLEWPLLFLGPLLIPPALRLVWLRYRSAPVLQWSSD